MRHVTTSLVLGLALALTACGTANDQPASGTLDASAAPAQPVSSAKSTTIKDDKQKLHDLSYDMAALDAVTLDGRRLALVPQYDIAFTDGRFLLKGKRGAQDLEQLELIDLDIGNLTHPDCEIGVDLGCGGAARYSDSMMGVESFAPASAKPDCDPSEWPCAGRPATEKKASAAKINAILGTDGLPPCDPLLYPACRPPVAKPANAVRPPDQCGYTGSCE